MKKLLKKPVAWIPIAMSGAALALVIGYLVLFGAAQAQGQQDEGTAARLFQLLMGGQVPIIAFFAISWLPRKPKETLQILLLQFIAGVIAFAPVYLLKL